MSGAINKNQPKVGNTLLADATPGEESCHLLGHQRLTPKQHVAALLDRYAACAAQALGLGVMRTT
jgi:hypothetical protein